MDQPVHFDVVFMDLQMPIMNGFDACTKIVQLYKQFNEDMLCRYRNSIIQPIDLQIDQNNNSESII